MSYTQNDLMVEVANLRKAFGDHRVLDGIDLAIPRGTVYALLGPNGAGKTTFVKILSTLLPMDSGTARIAGHDVVADPTAVRRAISVTGQFSAVDPLLTGRENLTLIARLGRTPRRRVAGEVSAMLERFDLTGAADRRVATYSGGMTRRLDIAISMLSRPNVLFLDEPTTGLDPRSRQAVWELMSELADRGVTVLLTTQYLEEADQLADRVAVLDGGGIVAEGSPAELKRRVGSDIVDIHYGDRVESLTTDGSFADIRRAILAVAERPEPTAMSIRTPSLDDVFLQLTGQPRTRRDREGVDA
ncbi:ATP-binding cassette domain-containing protein [Stackebrandtia endophytica]|nr:ATP-binding cassette domain-containing protein [Stackebrandtia endophytica]